MSDWKAGDYAMVEIVGTNKRDMAFCLIASNGETNWLPVAALYPLPPTITPEERAVIKAAVECETTPISDAGTRCLARLSTATRALIASRKPLDPLAELVAALDGVETVMWAGGAKRKADFWDALSAARAAVQK